MRILLTYPFRGEPTAQSRELATYFPVLRGLVSQSLRMPSYSIEDKGGVPAIEQSYKFRIYPTEDQKILIAKSFGCARWVYNHFLNLCSAAMSMGASRPKFYDNQAALTALKKAEDTVWLAEPDKYALVNALRDLDKAFENHFCNPSHFRCPRFKSKKNPKQSYRTNYFVNKQSGNENIEIDEAAGKIKLPKLSWVKASISRHVEGRILNVTVSRNACLEYYVSVTVTDVEFEQYEETGRKVGIDMGLHDLAILSDGTSIPNSKHYKAQLRKLKREQRKLSRKKKDSRNREKQKIRVARIHRDIANRRNDELHKATTKLVRDYDVIAVEDLSSANMAKNHHLAGAIYDAAWSEFRRQLEYKCARHGRVFLLAPRFYTTTQTCSMCGQRSEITKGLENLSVREWTCPHCGTVLDRDVNAAVNVLDAAMNIDTA